jgi:hypothetical protein
VKKLAALSLLLVASCGQDPAGLVLVFPSSADEMAATHATFIVVKPVGDQCPQFLAFPPAEPDPANILQTLDVDLVSGVPAHSLKGVVTGQETLLVKVQNQQSVLFLHGCRTGNVVAGTKFEINLQPLQNIVNDLSMGPDGPVDDLASPPPDMAQPKILTVTMVELRALARKMQGGTVALTDGSNNSVMGMTDANGQVKLDVTALTAPYQVVATGPISNGYTGGTVISAVTVSFTNNSGSLTVPVELDPPASSAGNIITTSVTDDTGTSYDVYAQYINAIYNDPVLKATGLGGGPIGNLAMGGTYRIGVGSGATGCTAGTQAICKMATPTPIEPVGFTYNIVKATPVGFATAFTLAYKFSTNPAFTVQKYGVNLLLPAAPSEAALSIITPTAYVASGTSGTIYLPVPGSVQLSASLQSEMVATGPFSRAELRHAVGSGAASDTFATAVPDPPAVSMPSPSPSPSPIPAANPIPVSAPLPANFSTTAAFFHIHIYDATNKINWHIVSTVSATTTVTIPGGILFSGSYTMDVTFAENFSLIDVTAAATLASDWSKLIRQLPQQLTQSTFKITVN